MYLLYYILDNDGELNYYVLLINSNNNHNNNKIY